MVSQILSGYYPVASEVSVAMLFLVLETLCLVGCSGGIIFTMEVLGEILHLEDHFDFPRIFLENPTIFLENPKIFLENLMIS